MEEERQELAESVETPDAGMRDLIQETIHEYLNMERSKAEPAHKVELTEERKRREQLEQRVNELVAENDRSRAKAEEAERSAAIRDELRRLGVSKVELGFRAVKDDVFRTSEGSLAARVGDGEVSLPEYLTRFTQENPELLPARIPGGSGASGAGEKSSGVGSFMPSILDTLRLRTQLPVSELDVDDRTDVFQPRHSDVSHFRDFVRRSLFPRHPGRYQEPSMRRLHEVCLRRTLGAS